MDDWKAPIASLDPSAAAASNPLCSLAFCKGKLIATAIAQSLKQCTYAAGHLFLLSRAGLWKIGSGYEGTQFAKVTHLLMRVHSDRNSSGVRSRGEIRGATERTSAQILCSSCFDSCCYSVRAGLVGCGRRSAVSAQLSQQSQPPLHRH